MEWAALPPLWIWNTARWGDRVLEIVQAIKSGMRPKNFIGLSTAETKREHLASLQVRHGSTTTRQRVRSAAEIW